MKKSDGGTPRYLKVIIGAALVTVIGVILSRSSSSPSNPAIESQPVIANNLNYSDAELVQMVDVSSKLQSGKITVPVDVVKKNKLVAFQYTDNARTVPLLAYIAPDGKLVTAVSLCEPCRSTRFHISGNNIVCNRCGSTWNLQNLAPVSGACGAYPPQVIPSKVVGNTVQIDVKTVADWQPRV